MDSSFFIRIFINEWYCCLQICKRIVYCLVKNEQSEGVFVNIGDLTIEELSNGYVNSGDTYACIFCKETFDAQEEFEISDRFYNAKYTVPYRARIW